MGFSVYMSTILFIFKYEKVGHRGDNQVDSAFLKRYDEADMRHAQARRHQANLKL
jgi:hypothetical protein